ncbi:MAG: alpha/beta hydrolase [Caulobacter sp.]
MTQTRRTLLAGVTALAAGFAAACSPLTLFATLAPRDPARRGAAGIAYGPDPRQALDVYTPAVPAAGRPVAVFFYGGSWDSGRRGDYRWVGQALASRGFVTVVADYRLYPQVRFPDFLDDCAAAVRLTVEHAATYGGDPSHIVLVGHSAGAYNAMMLALDPSYLRRAGVDPAVIRSVAGLAGPYDFLPLDGPITRQTFGEAADLTLTQPIHFVGAGAPRVFLATGEADTTVRPRNSRKLEAALREAGATVQAGYYPGVDHSGIVLALSRPLRGRAPVLDQMTAFLMAGL